MTGLLQFRITGLDEHPIHCGYLRWPWKVVRCVSHGDYWEIFDEEDVSVIALEDIHLDDLDFSL